MTPPKTLEGHFDTTLDSTDGTEKYGVGSAEPVATRTGTLDDGLAAA